ncbi:hypothetical protein AYO21_08180 [Fonsecaea monophora]|uniref:Tr-type G domain-containing protein n=1 Tax=Fonsecaea monophora TaxID=254056 RepID=A0A177F2N4_9EURO|nr:hypothetical protein AYO21_08180 [Fonsecaea monophora]OAG37572.1 hypothetical protein AYO21_08180 [Fonsecaea monophora]
MASIFTYQDEPPRIHSPWSTPGSSTPQPLHHSREHLYSGGAYVTYALMKLEPERQDGPTEYKLHLLLRPRRKFLSTTTSSSTPGSQHYTPIFQAAIESSRSLGDSLFDRPLSQPSAQTRQTRLQQLTTQLLWRLQQSSPFHSSSNADLVLPLLPEATPRLGVPERPAKLLPGLEESQGALYEIGVADDGMLAGLVEDELQESLTNLKAMAASLGCTTNILRKVPVGACEWVDSDSETGHTETRKDVLWVAEVLVYPDTRGSADADIPRTTLDTSVDSSRPEDVSDLVDHASTDQFRVTLVGATAAGKSSLLGTLSTSTLDNGRGKSRLSLLKHRHEIASGLTSSVAHELVGYSENRHSQAAVINYASGNVSSWLDIHNLAKRLVLLSDSPGLPKFSKSAFRSLISWRPSWTILCVAADGSSEATNRTAATSSQGYSNSGNAESWDLSLSYLALCLRLKLPLVVTITKMDIATKAGLRLVLAKILSALKAAGRKPVMLSSVPGPPPASEQGVTLPGLQVIYERDQVEVERLVESIRNDAEQRPFNLDSDGLSTNASQSALSASSYAAGRDATALRSKIPDLGDISPGTIGVELLNDEHATIALSRARKGMVLADVTQNLAGYRSFSARFPTSDFAQTTSPVLILGGHAIVYINSIRAAVKVTAVALDEDEQFSARAVATSSRDDSELFHFDIGDDDGDNGAAVEVCGDGDGNGEGSKPNEERREIRVSFRFVSTVEWMEVGDQVLVVPTMTATGPVTGPAPASNLGGLAGFIGTVCEVFS